MRVECPATLMTGSSGEALCRDQLGQAVAWVAVPEFEVDLSTAAEPFSAGFLLMASCWALGKGVALVIRLFK